MACRARHRRRLGAMPEEHSHYAEEARQAVDQSVRGFRAALKRGRCHIAFYAYQHVLLGTAKAITHLEQTYRHHPEDYEGQDEREAEHALQNQMEEVSEEFMGACVTAQKMDIPSTPSHRADLRERLRLVHSRRERSK